MDEKKKLSKGSEFWQIFFPGLAALILVGLACAWVVVGVNPGEIGRFAEISTVLLVIPVLIFSLLSFIILGLLIYLVQKMILGIPPYSARLLDFLTKLKSAVQKISDTFAQPVIRPMALISGIRSIFSKKDTRYRVE